MKKIFISWHYTTHGIAYLKHILSAYYISKQKELLEQEQLEKIFDESIENGFCFDEIIYLTAPQEVFNKISSRTSEEKNNIEAIDKETWMGIHHHEIKEQIKWLKDYSNFNKVYKPNAFKEKELKITDLRNEKQITEAIAEWAKTLNKEDDYIIDVSLGTSETQVVWYILAEKGFLPEKTKFIKTYDNKLEVEKRFKSFKIEEASTKLIQSININLFEKTKSESRELAKEKMKAFEKSGFSILLIGERGIGKSQIYGKDVTKINCAAFEGNEDKLEIELFGVIGGLFTGVKKGSEGAFKRAHGGKLFLDEIHHLSKIIQAKLMTAFGTDTENFMEFYKYGDLGGKKEKVKCQLIFATNKTIDELKERLLPDFYDRIVQNVIEIPPLRKTIEDREQDWESVWKQMRFNEINKNSNALEDEKLIAWLKNLPLYGNYRDLEKIAIYYNDFEKNFDELKKMLPEKTAFEYAKNEFGKWQSPKPETEENSMYIKLDLIKNSKEIHKDFHFELQKLVIEKYGKEKAAEILDVDKKTLNNWENRK
jgi:transcriptional regulator with AAA-type ATPase domain